MRLAIIAAALAASSAAAAEPDLARGRAVYRDACASCHGLTGGGDGPGAAELKPRPRDFVNGAFKFRSTASGARPLLRDVVRTVSVGIRGTWMPAFGKILTAEDLRAVSAYALQLAPPEEAAAVEVLVPPVEDLQPPADTPQLRDRGRKLYASMGCGQCHGPLGRGDGPAAAHAVNDEGESTAPADFTVGLYKGGSSPGDVYRTFVTGLDGTPMPSYAESLPDEADRWALVHYVRSLSRSPGLLFWLFGPRTPWE
ncbi:MAG: c-type cytochrome [Archangiaceae bacterium]|nr:c-type cytochrome [Archangiaceae bacterium]